MGQERWVSYIFRYRDNIKCENGGFIKVQKIVHKSDYFARIQIGVRLYKKKACKCLVYLVYGGKQAKYMTDIYIKPEERDTVIKRVELPWGNTLGDGISIEGYDGVFLVCDDGEVLAAVWGDEDVKVEDVHINRVEKEDTVAEDMETAYTEAESKDYMRVCCDMMEKYQKLPLFPDSRLIECVKIIPHDIGKLAIGNWRLGANSFLTHGYYHYRYLMLGKVKFDDGEKYVIGVPGVYTNKEKYLANMFGFNVFVPAKKTGMLSGNFGYWIWEVSSV